MASTKKFFYIRDQEKSKLLKEQRGIDFDDVVQCIAEGGLIDVVPHHNQQIYPHQYQLIILYKEYVRYIPCIVETDNITLKTIIPSRKYTKSYLTS